jgi:acyl-CoA dehydrogenase
VYKGGVTESLLLDTTARLFGERFADAPPAGEWEQAQWDLLTEQGLPLALVQGDQGFGIPATEGLALVKLSGRHAIGLPLAETMIGNALLAEAGLEIADGPIALADTGERVPWGRRAATMLAEKDGRLTRIDTVEVVTEGSNIAGMPRDTLRLDGPAQTGGATRISIRKAGALVRALQMAGALETLLEMTVQHTSERVQFGKPLAGFQAVQHSLSRLAGETAAASAAADLAADAYAEHSPHFPTAIAAARTRIGEAAGMAAGLAHQLHGAIGFTEEHRLHRFTTALWSWRDEFGTQAYWTKRLGALALEQSRASYWPFVTAV